MTYPHGAALLAVIASAATLTACSSKSQPASQPVRAPVSTTTTTQAIPGSGAAPAELMVDGHTHKISGPINCTAQAPNPTAKFPLGNLAISASDDTASFAMSWLSNAKSPLMALTLSFQVDAGEYTMPYYPQPPNIQASTRGNSYAVKGAPPVLSPGQSTLKNLPIEIHVTCP
jgi:hypothetical protein